MDSIPPDEEQDQHTNTTNCFSELSMAEEEDKTEAIFDLQHSYNTRSKGYTSQDNPPSTSTPSAGKAAAPKDKVIPKVEYNLVDDLKRDKANISLFDILKIPYIRENLPKNMVLNKSREVQNNNMEICAKPDGQKISVDRVPPFLLNF